MKHELSTRVPDALRMQQWLRSRQLLRLVLVTTLLAGLASGALAGSTFAATADESGKRMLRVCADPNNLPFSNERGEGFENRLAELIADELQLRVSYTWWAQRRGFARNTLNAGSCDVIMGVPSKYEMGKATRTYYRSSYVFVTRTADDLEIHTLDDPLLRTLRIGLHVIGDDFSNVPPAHALSSRGIIENVRGYSIYGDYSKPDPPRELIDALARKEIDVAIAWGPLGGYFALQSKVPMRVTRIANVSDGPLPMAFDISMAVRRDDEDLLGRLNSTIAARQSEINALLVEYGVPLISGDGDEER